MLCYQYFIFAFSLVMVRAVQDSTKPYYNLAHAEQHFTAFIDKYEKHYESAEEYNRRFETFKKKLSLINHWNEIHEASFDVNQFTDEEPSQNRTGFVPSKLRSKSLKIKLNNKLLRNAPTTLDYRTLGLVTKIKKAQIDCGSCYIFGAVGNIEGQYAKLTGELISLSEQHVLDCEDTLNACDVGGDDLDIIRTLSKGHGLVSDADYPYLDYQQKECINKQQVKVKVASGCSIYTPNEEYLKLALLKNGPLSISLYMSPSMDYYSGGGVFKLKDCPYNRDPNHVVLLVGYSKDRSGTPYWIIKNSYGLDWGHKGYLHLEMGKGHCSILKEGAVNAKVMRP
ncbi:procathepsin L-like [Cydia strobilella]|uniref:procathepsin L-like n=1 Tax=Cydia strobilella TaxID=1100964 RepID=UPI0030045862